MIVLDASALLALLQREPGEDEVAAVLDAGRLSTVNLSEVLARLGRDGHDPSLVLSKLRRSRLLFDPFDSEQAEAAARIAPLVRPFGLSFADRACLALAKRLDLPAMTADRAWLELPAEVGVRVVSIR